ncbi:MAG: YbaN family protein [Kofleriaceae bacterium]
MLGRAARIGYLILGCVFVALGVIGAFLPVMPTTVFMIGALWAFSLSSKRLEAWLLDHPRFGPRLVAWRAHRVIPRRVKLIAWTSMLASLGIMWLGRAPLWAIAAAAALMAIGAAYIASKPSSSPSEPRSL